MPGIWVRSLKVRLPVKVVLDCLIVTSTISIYYSLFAGPGFQRMYYGAVEEGNRQAVETVMGVLNSSHTLKEEGGLTTSKLQSHALAEIDDLRYGKDNEGAFWVNDYQSVLPADPAAPTLVNGNVGYITNENGESVFGDMVDICRNDGGEFYNSNWSYAGGDEAEKEHPSVAPFEPWGYDLYACKKPFNYQMGLIFGAVTTSACMLIEYSVRGSETYLLGHQKSLRCGRDTVALDYEARANSYLTQGMFLVTYSG